MILILGGTTEGRNCVKVLDEAGSPFYYSTKGSEQQVESRHGSRLTGGLTFESMAAFCKERGVRLIIDAAHPFATELHRTAAEVSEACGIQAVRYERTYPPLHPSDILCSGYEEAVTKMKHLGVRNLLALTGVKTIGKLKPFWNTPALDGGENRCHFRILDRPESFSLAERSGFPKEQLLTYDEETSTEELIAAYRPDALITKESGESGGFEDKEEAALKAGIPLFVIRRPVLPDGFLTVTGKHGLRKAVESFVPGFYPLRSGFTTGSCATVAAKAALLALLGKETCGSTVVPFLLPDGEELKMESRIREITADYAVASTIKDAGDDPDIINGHEIRVKVAYARNDGGRADQLAFLQGTGVGRVTLPGLGIPIGQPAINKTPKAMIRTNLTPLYAGPLDITISIPDGEELAKRTFNPKLGIVGGLSVIGTSGIVHPYSAEAFAEAICREIEVAVALGIRRIVMNSGAKSESYVKSAYPELPAQAFIHYGNFIGSSLEAAFRLKVPAVTLGIMLGKAVKLAAGHLDTHSKNVVMDKSFLKQTAVTAGCSEKAIETIESVTLARELWSGLTDDDGNRFFPAIARLCHGHCREVYPEGSLTLMLIDEDGRIRARIDE